MKFQQILAIIILITASLGQLNRLFIGDGDLVLYANDILVGLLAALYLGHALIIRKSLKVPPPMLAFGVFLITSLFGLVLALTVLSANQLIVSISYWLRFACYAVLFFVVYDSIESQNDSEQRNKQVNRWVNWVIIASVLVAISGFIQLYVLPDLAILARYGWDPHVGRLTTAMLDPNYAGTYLGIGSAVVVSLFLYTKNSTIQGKLLPVIALLFVAILLTYSRSGYLMLAISLGIIAVIKSRWLIIAGAVVAVLAYLFVPRIQDRIQGAISIDASASPRIISWQNSLYIAGQNQPFGVGLNAYRYAQDRYNILSLEESGNAGAGADSSWLFILATTGILGLTAFVAMYASFTWFSLKGILWGPSDTVKAISLATLAMLGGLAASSMFNNALFYTWILELFWVLTAIMMAVAQKPKVVADAT